MGNVLLQCKASDGMHDAGAKICTKNCAKTESCTKICAKNCAENCAESATDKGLNEIIPDELWDEFLPELIARSEFKDELKPPRWYTPDGERMSVKEEIDPCMVCRYRHTPDCRSCLGLPF